MLLFYDNVRILSVTWDYGALPLFAGAVLFHPGDGGIISFLFRVVQRLRSRHRMDGVYAVNEPEFPLGLNPVRMEVLVVAQAVIHRQGLAA